MKTRRIFAHRGLTTHAPENTLAACKAAIDRGFTWVEVDVDILADGTAILCHDLTLDRTTNRSGGYSHLHRDDLAGIDAGSWFGKQFAGEPVPTLAELIQLMNQQGLNANIELKSNGAGKHAALRLVDSVLGDLEQLNEERKVIISSFNHPLLTRVKELEPRYPLGCLYETATLYDDWKTTLELVGADHIHPEDTGLTSAQVQKFRDAGFGVNVWTVNSRARANELFNWGATGVFTDNAIDLADFTETQIQFRSNTDPARES